MPFPPQLADIDRWDVEAAEVESGGSLPDWWEINSTPGAESLTLEGNLVLHQDPGIGILRGLQIQVGTQAVLDAHAGTDPDTTSVYFDFYKTDGTYKGGFGANPLGLEQYVGTGQTYEIIDDGAGTLLKVSSAGVQLGATGEDLGFYGTAPIAKPTGVAVSAAGVHAALVTLGLIAA